MTKLAIITGSPRPDGNTEQIADFIHGMWVKLGERSEDVKIIRLREHFVAACGFSQTCGDCNHRTEPCKSHDDVAGIIEEMKKADAIIYGTPVYGFGTASLMQAFIERAGVGDLRYERPLANKIGGVYVTGHQFNLGAVHDQIINNLLLNRMIVPGAGFPATVQGAAPGNALINEKGMASVFNMVERVHQVAAAFRTFNLSESLTMSSRNEADRNAFSAYVEQKTSTLVQLQPLGTR